MYVNSMKHLVQGTVVPNEQINELVRILDFEPLIIIVHNLVEIPVVPTEPNEKKVKTKT